MSMHGVEFFLEIRMERGIKGDITLALPYHTNLHMQNWNKKLNLLSLDE